MSTIAVNSITNVEGGNTAIINGMTPTADSLQGFRNRIINGDMRIDQRNAGASVTPAASAYTLDRWVFNVSQASKASIQQNAGSATLPSGFTNYLGVTSTSTYSVGATDLFALQQPIEGFNVADLAWGTAGAKAVTLSFWVRSSLTGIFGGSIQNSVTNRCYPFSYTVSSANTWEQKTVTIPGDTSGTWVTNNGVGLRLFFGLGVGSTYSGAAGSWSSTYYLSATGAISVVGTSGATFYITGVQLEAGSVGTPFERSPYGTELALCQRYYETGFDQHTGGAPSGNGLSISCRFSTTKRSAPTMAGAISSINMSSLSYSSITINGFSMGGTTTSSVSLFNATWSASSEL